MILVVKGKNYKRLAIKAFSYVGLIVMFYFYYNHMSDRFSQTNQSLVKKLHVKVDNKKNKLTKKLEKLIYKESERIVDLLGQHNIISIKIIEGKLYIVCNYNTDIEPLLVRYGVKAMMRQNAKNVKIAIDLKFIVESRYES
jgi:predicted nuclease with TOPRIM domain